MKNHRRFLLTILTVVVFVLAACGNTSDEPDTTAPTQTNEPTQGTNDETINDDEDISTNGASSLKEQYLQKLHDTKEETDAMEPIDDTTFALKKVEGDRYDIWDGLLNEIYGVLEEKLSAEEMEQLREEQREWIAHRDAAAKEASLKYEGGTMEQLEYVAVVNKLTEERCFELVEGYMN